MTHAKRLLFLLLAGLLPLRLLADVKLPAIFTDNMVLQRESEVKLWGTAAPERTVRITTSWDGARHEVPADAAGHWTATVRTPEAGGPHTITFTDGRHPVTLSNVLIGEVWICSGQSNMEMRVGDRVTGMEQELAEAEGYPEIRLLHIDNTTSPAPLAEAKVRDGGWQVCSADHVRDFSATGYFFGKELHRELGVPVGLIETCWGGTLAEAWTSGDALWDIPAFRDRVAKARTLPATPEERTRIFHEDLDRWRDEMAAVDPGYRDSKPLWAASTFDDTAWGEIQAPGFVQHQGLGSFTGGFLWMRRTVEIPAAWAGKELTLELAVIDDNDFTYFDGVEVGHTEGCMAFRRYTVPASLVRAGRVTIAVRVMDTGGLGGIFGDPKSMSLRTADGDVLPLAGTWKYHLGLGLGEAPELPVNTATEPNFPSFLYNAMIHPLVGYGIRGAIWYQGEANVARAAQYRDLLPLMIRDWRSRWGYDFPFYIVQLANYMKVQEGPEESEWAELREAQTATLRLENTGMAVIIDIGEADDIHPKNKPEVGRRLALQALAKSYGRPVLCSGPMYAGCTLGGGEIRIRFSHTDGGLKTVDGGVVKGFCIAGGDHRFHMAEARIEGDEVIVRSPEVAYPVAVRYAWANNPVCNLTNGTGLPAGPFRTDDWTDGK